MNKQDQQKKAEEILKKHEWIDADGVGGGIPILVLYQLCSNLVHGSPLRMGG